MDSDLRADAREPGRGVRASQVQAGVNRAGMAGMAALFCGLVVLQADWPWGWIAPPALYLLLWLLVGHLSRGHYPYDRFGPANTVTSIRAALVCALLGPLLSGAAAGWGVVLIGTVALALDGVDGRLARQSGLVSNFGARFDMEIDSILALLLAVHAFIGTAAGAEVHALGLIRYVFVAASVLWPWLAHPLPQRWRRKAICVVQLATLIILQIPSVPGDAAIVLSRAAFLLVLYYFAVDVISLRARRQ